MYTGDHYSFWFSAWCGRNPIDTWDEQVVDGRVIAQVPLLVQVLSQVWEYPIDSWDEHVVDGRACVLIRDL